MNSYFADLHVHTSLSPCAEPEMTPEAIVGAARARGLSLIAICDHDAAGSCEPVCHLAGPDLCVIAGIEVTIEGEKHVLGLFQSPSAALAVEREIAASAGQRPSLVLAVEWIRRHAGLAIAAHVDRPASGILGRGGQLPRDVKLDALEISKSALGSQMRSTLEALGFVLTTGSDSHCLEDIGSCRLACELQRPSFAELVLAIRGQEGRRCSLA